MYNKYLLHLSMYTFLFLLIFVSKQYIAKKMSFFHLITKSNNLVKSFSFFYFIFLKRYSTHCKIMNIYLKLIHSFNK